MDNLTKIGLFGGTFDPVHIAHLAIAELAAEQLELTKVLFIPAWVAPHKTDRVDAAKRSVARIKMLELAISGNEKFEVCDIEINRKGASYTIDTLEQLRQTISGEIFLLIGSDNYLTFNSWREPEKIHKLATVAVYNRPGSRIDKVVPPFIMLEGPQMDITSTWIRERMRAGKRVRYFLPEEVEKYIIENKIYY